MSKLKEINNNNLIEYNNLEKRGKYFINSLKKKYSFASLDVNNVPISLDNNSISYALSNVGYPMLIVNQFPFHKHSVNAKTCRINWRCSRRRVKNINCSSSCYTVNGIVSNPTSHVSSCYPITKNIFSNQNKSKTNLNKSKTNFINTKAESYTTLKNRIENEKGKNFDKDYSSIMEELIDSDYDESKSKYQNDSDSSKSSINKVNDYSSKSMKNLLSQLNYFKQRKTFYLNSMNRISNEIEKVKKSSAFQIQALKFKITTMEIGMNSIKQVDNQQTEEIIQFKDLINDILTEFKSKSIVNDDL